MRRCDRNPGSRKILTMPRLVAPCTEPPHQLESSSLLHPDAQTHRLPRACLVLCETLSLRRMSGGTARSGFRERHQEGGEPRYVWYVHLLTWACFWKLSFYSEVIISTEGGKQRKRGRFAKWFHVKNQSSTNLFPLHSLTSSTLHFCSWCSTVQLTSLWLHSSGQFLFF